MTWTTVSDQSTTWSSQSDKSTSWATDSDESNAWGNVFPSNVYIFRGFIAEEYFVTEEMWSEQAKGSEVWQSL
jgi:hypothetical protein